ncbi:hypothetical protein M8997_013430 [Phyllobacterium sp. 21LDTY02-6]|uniref:hypothetical protein n=1 Tax=Phyllobacterium sp. 21LDTY02-6 TaxID=2944903 RepID=UPI0020220D3E|nr:hypothetical protein [Phyllobacterium sp. 21LDTY02-6]MCO4318190.1 hypothetical protein [Phyllobacterium sp. 21LDTY02-6]
MTRTRAIAASIVAYLALCGTASSAIQTDPTWPCVQRKVPELSVAQVWTGPELPESADDWDDDPQLRALVDELAARRNPLEDAQRKIVEFAKSLPKDQANAKLLHLFRGVFDTLDGQRRQIISGIARYADKQRELADDLRTESSKIDAMRAKSDVDPDDLDRANERLTWETRIFEERVQSLTYVCEVPTIIEQRLYGLAKTIEQSLHKD